MFLIETEDDSPTDDQVLKCSPQNPNFSRIGDQWVAISSPGVCS